MSRGGGPVAVARAAAAATASAGEERGGGAPAAPAAAPCCDGDTSSGAPSPTPGSAPPPGHAAARTGRHRQRFDASGARLVAGAIPVRTRAGPGGGAVVEVLMIRSTRGEGLIFPKGGWETDESVEEAAGRESWEEAGVRGVLQETLGVLEFVSRNKRHVGHFFVMRVTEELAVWPESEVRHREWCCVPDAIARCRHPWMRDVITRWWASRAAGQGEGAAGAAL